MKKEISISDLYNNLCPLFFSCTTVFLLINLGKCGIWPFWLVVRSENNNSSLSSEFEDGPRSNLDSIRYGECVNYLQDYAPQHLLSLLELAWSLQ